MNVLSAWVQRSKNISDNKITSARLDSWVEIPKIVKQSAYLITNDHFQYQPKIPSKSDYYFPRVKNIKTKEAMKACTKENFDECHTFGAHKYLFSPEYERYCQKPSNQTLYQKIVQHFTFSMMDGDGNTINATKISPPFLHTHESIVKNVLGPNESVQVIRFNTMDINAILFVPRIVHLLYAQLEKKTTAQLEDDPIVRDLSLFIVRYQIQYNQGTTVLMHGIANSAEHYNIAKYHQEVFTQHDASIVGATFCIMSFIHLVFTHPMEFLSPDDQKTVKLSITKWKKMFNKQLDTFCNAFSTLGARTARWKQQEESSLSNSITNTLGMSFPFFISYFILVSTNTLFIIYKMSIFLDIKEFIQTLGMSSISNTSCV
jgi:hypothetical protein